MFGEIVCKVLYSVKHDTCMDVEKRLIDWAHGGIRREAVAQVLRKPMTPTEIASAASSIDPHIRLDDMWLLLSEFKEQGLVFCLNRSARTGRLFFLTELGCQLVAYEFGIDVPWLEPGMDWDAYSFVIRSSTRAAVVMQMGSGMEPERTAAQVWRGLMQKHAIGLNSTIRALKQLLNGGLVECIGETRKGSRKLYRLSEKGDEVLGQMVK